MTNRVARLCMTAADIAAVWRCILAAKAGLQQAVDGCKMCSCSAACN